MQTFLKKLSQPAAVMFAATFALASCGGGGDGGSTGGTGGTSMTITPADLGLGPDLVLDIPTVTVFSIIPGFGVLAGERFILNFTVRNIGTIPSIGAQMNYYRSTDATITAADDLVSTTHAGRIASLMAGESIIVSPTINATTIGGTYYYGGCINTFTGETDSTNNCSPGLQVIVTQ